MEHGSEYNPYVTFQWPCGIPRSLARTKLWLPAKLFTLYTMKYNRQSTLKKRNMPKQASRQGVKFKSPAS